MGLIDFPDIYPVDSFLLTFYPTGKSTYLIFVNSLKFRTLSIAMLFCLFLPAAVPQNICSKSNNIKNKVQRIEIL